MTFDRASWARALWVSFSFFDTDAAAAAASENVPTQTFVLFWAFRDVVIGRSL